MEKPKCIVCGEELELGRFAYCQEQCWSCFILTVSKIMLSLRTHPDLSCEDANNYYIMVGHMANCMAEIFGEPNPYTYHNETISGYAD